MTGQNSKRERTERIGVWGALSVIEARVRLVNGNCEFALGEGERRRESETRGV